ncbi:MAG TPA: MlaD family protein [Methylocystis sp.]|nr:MlaD family protein [Methylocystis sp.]
METRANFALIGLFALAVVFASFAFIYWVAGASGGVGMNTYELVVRGSVEGLTTGSAVQFNGLKVGEVKSLEIDREDPSLVDVLIDVDKRTPVKADTRARLDVRGLTGVAYVALVGGTREAADLKPRPGEKYARIAAERSEIQDLMENVQKLALKATATLDRLDKFLETNSDDLSRTIKNIEAFSQTLADNRDNAAGILRDGAEIARSLKPIAAHVDHLLADADRTIKALDPKQLKTITGNLADVSTNFNRFSGSGLRQYEQLAADARKALETLDRAVRNLERDPSQFIFGPSEKVPQVEGR